MFTFTVVGDAIRPTYCSMRIRVCTCLLLLLALFSFLPPPPPPPPATLSCCASAALTFILPSCFDIVPMDSDAVAAVAFFFFNEDFLITPATCCCCCCSWGCCKVSGRLCCSGDGNGSIEIEVCWCLDCCPICWCCLAI